MAEKLINSGSSGRDSEFRLSRYLLTVTLASLPMQPNPFWFLEKCVINNYICCNLLITIVIYDCPVSIVIIKLKIDVMSKTTYVTTCSFTHYPTFTRLLDIKDQ